MTGTSLRRYERPRELPGSPVAMAGPEIAPQDLGPALAGSALGPGSRDLLRALLRLGAIREFGGGGVGIEYGSLLKTSVRPDLLAGHISEAADHLQAQRANLLVVPGMSGYPIGAMYALAAGLPGLLLKKGKLQPDGDYPAGSFVIPSYTGDGDVVMSADVDAARDLLRSIAEAQLEAQAGSGRVRLEIRIAGADDIIDKGTMSQAVGESGIALARELLGQVVGDHRAATGDARPIEVGVEVVAWVTPLMKGYNGPQEQIRRLFGITPFAGLTVTGLRMDPPAIGIEGLGVVPFRAWAD